MKLRHLFSALLLATAGSFASAAQAQAGIYLNPVATHFHIADPDSGAFSFLGDGQTSRWFGGIDWGGYYDFHHARSYNVGIDIRDTIVHGNNAKLNSFNVGVRVSGNPMRYGFKPYGQLSIGAGHTKPELSTVGVTRAAWAVTGGLDHRIAKYVDFRMIEVSYGTVTTISSEQKGSDTHVPAARMISLSSGLVFRFGK